MQLNLSYTKIFTILLSITYMLGIVGVFFNCEILIAAIVTFFLICLILLSDFSIKKSIILFFIFLLGIFRAEQSLNIDKTLKNITSNNAILKGQIISSKDISHKNKKLKFYIRVSEANFADNIKENQKFKDLNSKVLISANLNGSIENNISIGDYIEIKGKFVSPKTSQNPHEFNYSKYLFNNDCLNILYASPNSFKITRTPELSFDNPKESWYFILKNFEETRNKIIEKHSAYISSPKLEVLAGIVFGNETINPDEKIKEDFTNSGLLHLLAASGLNVALIFGIWWFIVTLIKFPYRISIIIGAVFIVLYTFMTGFPPSILRASIMLLFVLLGKLIDRNTSSVALIFFVGFLILLFFPKMIFDIGFQLSFMVTMGLIVCCPVILSKFENADKRYKKKYKHLSTFKKYFFYIFSPVNIASCIFVPLIAQLWVIPLQMHYFNNFAPFSVPANIAVVPFIGILSFIGFISSIIALFPFINNPVIYIFDFIANPLLSLLIKISEIFGSFKFSLISTIGLNVLQIFNFWILLLIFTLNLKNNFKNRKEKIILLVFIIIFTLSFIKPCWFTKNLEINMFDVENSDCLLIKTPKNKYIMINSGKYSQRSPLNSNMFIKKYLQNERIKILKLLVITSFNSKNSLSAIDIIKNVKIDKTIIQNNNLTLDIPSEIINSLKENKINYEIAQNNSLIYKEKDFEIHSFNHNSIILYLKYKDKSALLLTNSNINDVELIKKYLPNKIDVIEIGKSGNNNPINETAINYFRPSYILISNGKNKSDNPNNINLLYNSEVKVIKTENYGFVKIIFKKNILDFYNFNKNSGKLSKIMFYPSNNYSNKKYIEQFIKNNQ